MRKIALMAMPVLALSFGACGGDDSGKNDGSTISKDMATNGGDAASGDMAHSSFPAAPTLGTQIDRFGRPGINTALTDPFYDDAMTASTDQHHMNQDAYNAESDPTKWSTISIAAKTGTATLVKQFETNLAIYDALDGTCGDQLAFNVGGTSSAPTNYATLATVLANDQLFVNTASGSCAVYLGVEANFLGVTNDDCGGRTPTEDVIDVTYNGLANAGLGVNCTTGKGCAVGDGIAADPDGVPSNTAFPFFNAP